MFVAKQGHDAIGHCQSRVLTLDQREELEVMNPVSGAEATSLTTCKQGEIPSSYLSEKTDDQLNLEQMR